MLTTWRALQTFAATADAYLSNHKNETKLAYAIKRVRDQIAKHSEQVQALLLDIEIDLCVVDDRDVIQRDAQGNLQFTRANFKERNQRQRALLEREFTVEPFYVLAMPEDLTPAQLEAFSGLILPEAILTDRNGGPPPPEVIEEEREVIEEERARATSGS